MARGYWVLGVRAVVLVFVPERRLTRSRSSGRVKQAGGENEQAGSGERTSTSATLTVAVAVAAATERLLLLLYGFGR